MSGRDACLVAGTVAVCGIFGYLWTKRQTDSITSSKSEEQQISSLNCNDLEEDRVPVGGQWFDAVILHALEDETAARLCQQILQEQINVPNLQIGLPDDIITPGTSTLDGIGSLISNCRLVIIYHSRFLSMDDFMLFGKQANIIQSLEDPQKRDRIIPFIVDGEELSLDMCTIHPVNYVNDIRSANFPSFKNKMERLFLMWREKIP